jgi:HAD superfamily hydrolase (TIGR01450 family)
MASVPLPTLPTLQHTDMPLAQVFDVALLDLDGVVYVGPAAVPGAPEALAQARSQGMRLAFVTNNAARPPLAVAEHLTELGITAEPAEVTTSAQAAAHYLADRLPADSAVLVVGTVGLYEALAERGLRPVSSADDKPVAVVQGYSPTLGWADLAEGMVAIGNGALWVATNLDPTVPSPRGPLPGNGSLVAALRHASGASPIVTGKPEPTMHRESVERSRAERPIVVGDRLDTDIEGANAVGCPSLLVLSGVTGAADLLAAPAVQRPNFLGADLSALLYAHPAPQPTAQGATLNGWSASVTGHRLRLTCIETEGSTADGLDPLRVLCATAWQAAGDARGAFGCAADDAVSRSALEALALV